MLALAGCGPESLGSPGGTGVEVIVNNPSAPPTTPTPTVTPVVAAGACPTVTNDGSVTLTDRGTISGPTGSYRVCELPSLITRSVTLEKKTGLLYALNGRVDVGCDGGPSVPTAGAPYASTTIGCGTRTADSAVNLTIDKGVIVFARTGQSWIAVNRGNKITANGTATQPIIFTSQDNVAGLNTDTTPGGQWGGIVLLGRGRTTDCSLGSVASDTCQRDTEGAVTNALFGGTDDTYNAGSMSYVQIRYSGFVLSNNKELQSLTTGGVGTGTTLNHIQSHRSSDDGAEFFGGNFNISHYVATAADDDSLDVDTGARVNMQYALLIQAPGEGDALMEIDSNGFESDTPRTKLTVANFLAVQPNSSANNEGNDKASTLFRGNADVTLVNGAIISPNNECISMSSNTSLAQRATLTVRSLVLQCSATKFIGGGNGVSSSVAGDGEFVATDVAGFFATGTNNNNDSFVNTLTGGFINGANENAVVTSAFTGLSSFFTATPTPYRIGAAWAENNAWYTGWTCSSSVANFGSTSLPCTTLPAT